MLTETKIKKHPLTSEEQILRDSRGLFLILPAGSGRVKQAAWRVRLTRDGKTRQSTVGYWPGMDVDRARKERDKLSGRNVDLGITVQEAVDNYRQMVTDHQKSGYQAEVYLRHFLDTHKHIRLATVTRAECVTLLSRYAKERGPRSADRFLSQLRGIFNLAVELGHLETSPLLGVSNRMTGYKAKARDRVLSSAEILTLWSWEGHNAALCRFLLLTGLRIAEAQKGHREGDRWLVPAQYSKNGRAHWVHLSEIAIAQLDYAFNTSPTAVQAWVKRKQKDSEDRYTPHDLRRTAATLMADNGVEAFIVERCLGHTMQGVMAVYNHAEYAEERENAAKVLETVVLGIVNAKD